MRLLIAGIALVLLATPASGQGSKAQLNAAAKAEGCTPKSSKTWSCGSREKADALLKRFRDIESKDKLFAPTCTTPLTNPSETTCEVSVA